MHKKTKLSTNFHYKSTKSSIFSLLEILNFFFGPQHLTAIDRIDGDGKMRENVPPLKGNVSVLPQLPHKIPRVPSF